MPKIVRRGGFIACVSAALCALLVAGCSDECKKGKSECVNGKLIRTCVPTSDSNEWLVHECGTTEVCVTNPEVLNGGGSDAGKTKTDGGATATSAGLTSGIEANADNGSGAACVGSCLTGDKECASDTLARHCISDGVWQFDACNVGEKCSDGDCKASNDKGARQACVPGTKMCAGDKAEQVCNEAGTGWAVTMCMLDESCQGTECKADPKSSCDDVGMCKDNKTAIRCAGMDKGFELVECKGDTYCEGGRCRGPACIVGSFCNGTVTAPLDPSAPPGTPANPALPTIRECSDGTNFKDIVCGANEVCQQVKDVASCVKKKCNPGTVVCGDPLDPKADKTKTYTTCAFPDPAGSTVPEWVTGTCGGSTTCNPALAGIGANPCVQECTPGATRCNNAVAPGSTLGWGTQTCTKDGKWGAIVSCNPKADSEMQCVNLTPADASQLPKAVCTDPICAWVLGAPGDGSTGFCDSTGKLHECLPNGQIADATACKVGSCVNVETFSMADGRTPGACPTTPVCQTGDTKCVTEYDPANNTGGSLFQTCVNGQWSTTFSSCAKDGLCHDIESSTGRPSTQCGGECTNGNRQCDPADTTNKKIQTCVSGKWGTGVACDLGTCKPKGVGDASCVLECVPDSIGCTGSDVVAADGYHMGKTQQQKCGKDGNFATPTDCTGDTTCRTGGSGADIGCVECIGGSVPGGNEEGVVDTRCDPANPTTKAQSCGTDNKFVSHTCATNTTCSGSTGAVCGNCWSGADNTYNTCTPTNINDTEICGGCDVALTGGGTTAIPNCTQTSIAAVSMASSTTCVGQGFGAPSKWNVFSDCCGTGGTFTRGGNTTTCENYPFASGGTTVKVDGADCCSFAVEQTSFSSAPVDCH